MLTVSSSITARDAGDGIPMPMPRSADEDADEPVDEAVDPNTPSSVLPLVDVVVSDASVDSTGVALDVEDAAGAGEAEVTPYVHDDDDVNPAHKEVEESPQLTSKSPAMPFVSDGK